MSDHIRLDELLTGWRGARQRRPGNWQILLDHPDAPIDVSVQVVEDVVAVAVFVQDTDVAGHALELLRVNARVRGCKVGLNGSDTLTVWAEIERDQLTIVRLTRALEHVTNTLNVMLNRLGHGTSDDDPLSLLA